MMESLFADGMMAGLENRIVMFVFKCLAVGGGFLVGYFLGFVVAWALDRWAFAHKAPDQLKKAVSILAGVALAIIVALIVFGDGGSGLFGGAGEGEGKGTSNPDDQGKTDPTPPVTPKKEEIPPKKNEPVTPIKPADATIRVTILGGRDVPGDDLKFYLIDDDQNRKSFDELKDAILSRKAKEKGTVAISVHFRAKEAPSLDPRHYSISQLEKWAKETAKMDVILAAQK